MSACLLHWLGQVGITLEDVMQVGALQALVDLTQSPGLLPSVMVRLNFLGNCWFQKGKHVKKSLP